MSVHGRNDLLLTSVDFLHDGHQAVEAAGDEGQARVQYHDVRLVLVHHPHTLGAVEPLSDDTHTRHTPVSQKHNPHTLGAWALGRGEKMKVENSFLIVFFNIGCFWY